MKISELPTCPPDLAVTGIVPYIHVADVQRSIEFYARLGMECESRFGPEGKPYWARMKSPGGMLMLGLADGAVDPRVQATLLYLYTPDLVALREYLVENGLRDGGSYSGDNVADPFPASGVVFEIRHPDYLPMGEMRVHDPDGYVLMIARTPESP